jgi:hypothetical protein
MTGQACACRLDIPDIQHARHPAALITLLVIRKSHHLRWHFREEFFYREDFVHLYDELFTSGKRSSRS